jgi:hypothetical protein
MQFPNAVPEEETYTYALGWKTDGGYVYPVPVSGFSVGSSGKSESLRVGSVYFPGTSFLRSDARDTATAPIIFNTGGRLAMYSDSASQAAINITLRDDSARGLYLTPGNQLPSAQASLLFVTGNLKPHRVGEYTDWTRYGEIGYGNHAIGFYGGDSTKFAYLDVSGTSAYGVYAELNYATTNSTTGIYHILDYSGGGRGICEKFYDQGSGGTHPLIILTGDGTADSSMIYRNKAKIDTIATKHIVLSGSDTLTISNANDTTFITSTASVTKFNNFISDSFIHSYGSFSDSNALVACDAGLWSAITNAQHTLFNVGEATGITVAGDSATVLRTGEYKIDYSFTFSALNGKDYDVGLAVMSDTTIIGAPAGMTTTGTANFSNVAGFAIGHLDSGDVVKPVVKCVTDGTDPTFRSGAIYLQLKH